jgi:hypothetical protein
LDVVTLGTPVRYGWDAAGYGNLLHFIHHRPVDGLPDDRAPFLPSAEDILQAKQGDCVQQLGIAGTNFTPPAWAWLADTRLGTYCSQGFASGTCWIG